MVDDLFTKRPSIERPSPSHAAEKEWTLLDTGPEFKGPQPWCRLCKKPIALWAWILSEDTAEADLYVHCHNEEMHCTIPNPLPSFCVVEAFCFDDPHAENGFWWVVRPNGTIVQESKQYIATNVGSALFGSKYAKALRSGNGGWVLSAVVVLYTVIQLIWIFRGIQ